MRIEVSPESPKIVKFQHGSVTADWSADAATATAQSASFSFAITDIIVDVQTDMTAEISTQDVPFRCDVYKNTGSASAVVVHGGIPNNCAIHFNSPVIIDKSVNYTTKLQLGGATAATCDVYLVGFDRF